MIAAETLAAALRRHGVEVMYSQSLPSQVVLACEDAGIRQVTYRTENAGGAMADGYARLSNRLGVVCAQNGPAATLLVPPLAEALKSSIPILAIVQDVNRADVDRNAFQEFDHLALFQSCTKWARRVGAADRVADYIDMAVVAATTGRPGPVVLLLPADLLNERVPAIPFPRTLPMGRWPLDRAVADPDAIEEAAEAIAGARRPVVIAGGGVHGADAAGELAALQETVSLPIATTMMGKGAVDEGHPLTIGLVGNAMGALSTGIYLKPMLDTADVVLLVGTRTNQNGTDSWRLFSPDARFIQIDIDGCEIGRTYEALRLVGDAKLTLAALTAALRRRDLSLRDPTCGAIADEIANARSACAGARQSVCLSGQVPIRPERVMRELDARLTPETTVVADASYSSVWITSYLTARRPGMRFVTPRGLAGLGWGLPLAIGAKLAGGEAPVICVVGDGGFGHVWSEIETLVRESIPVVVIVLNNAVLGYQKDAEDVKFGRHTSACRLSEVDHAAIALACGCEAERVETPSEIAEALARAVGSNAPYLLDIMTDPEAYPPLSMFDRALDAHRERKEADGVA